MHVWHPLAINMNCVQVIWIQQCISKLNLLHDTHKTLNFKYSGFDPDASNNTEDPRYNDRAFVTKDLAVKSKLLL